MKRLLRGLHILLIGGGLGLVAMTFVVYSVQQQAMYRASPAGLIAEAANTIAEGGRTHTLGDSLVTVLSGAGILALISIVIWLAATLFPRQPQRRRYQRRRYQRSPQALQLPAGQQRLLRQEIQRLEQHLQRLEQQPYQQYPENLDQEEETSWGL